MTLKVAPMCSKVHTIGNSAYIICERPLREKSSDETQQQILPQQTNVPY